jgi:hypothetical protein
MKINIPDLKRNFEAEDLGQVKQDLEAIDLSHEFSFYSTALKVSLISAINFMDAVIRQDGSDQEKSNLYLSEAKRNILFAKMLIGYNNESEHNPAFTDALSQVQYVLGASEEHTCDETTNAIRLDPRTIKYKSNALPFLEISKEKDTEGRFTTKGVSLYIEKLDEFDSQGFTNSFGMLFDSFFATYPHFRKQLDYEFKAILASEEKKFDKLYIQDLDLKDQNISDRLKRRVKVALCDILQEYLAENFALNNQLQEALAYKPGIQDDTAGLAYFHETVIPESEVA